MRQLSPCPRGAAGLAIQPSCGLVRGALAAHDFACMHPLCNVAAHAAYADAASHGEVTLQRNAVWLQSNSWRTCRCGALVAHCSLALLRRLSAHCSEYLALPVSPQQEGQRIGAFTGSSPLTQAAPGGQVLDSRADMLNTREAPHSTSRLPAGLQSGPPLPEVGTT